MANNNYLRNTVGFDELLDWMMKPVTQTYPPYNVIEENLNGTLSYVIQIAVAGIPKNEIYVGVEDNVLVVKYLAENREDGVETEHHTLKYLHRGIADRRFELAWKFNKDDFESPSASMDNGILEIFLKKKNRPKELSKVEIR